MANELIIKNGLIVDSGVVQITGSLTTTGSNKLIGDTSLTGSLNITGSTLQVGSNTLIGNTILSGSIGISGSSTIQGTTTMTGSLLITGSTTQKGNNTLEGTTTLSGSINISGNTTVTGSITALNQTASFGYVSASFLDITGKQTVKGYTQFLPTSDAVPITVPGGYIYSSGSQGDLYFAQTNGTINNVIRLRWLEGNMYSGLLNGGVITTQSSTVYQVSSGSGIIVSLNGSLSSDPYPAIDYISWNNLSSSIAPLSASFDQSFVAIEPSGSKGIIYVQGVPYDDGQFNTLIPIGNVIHQNRSTINATATYPNVAYGYKQRSSDFIRAFGPLKLTGLDTIVSGSSTGSLQITSGKSYSEGRNYITDVNNPSYVQDTGQPISKIFRYYQSGSGWVYLTNGGAGFETIDPTQYSLNGVLTPVPGTGANREFSIQRVFYFPGGATKGIYVYYGNQTYPTALAAIANIAYESFIEAPNTSAGAVLSAYLVVRNNADFTVADSYNIRPAGLFRNIGGTGGAGGAIAQTLSGLSDVDVLTVLPTNGQPLVYDSVTQKWKNSSSLTANLIGTASFATTASFVSGIVATASFAATSSNVLGGTANYIPLWNTNNSLSSSALYQSASSIGIGTTLPSASLHVRGATTSSLSSSFYVENQTATASFSVLDNGFVGIGTTAPTAKLQVTAGDMLIDNNRGFFSKNTGGSSLSLLKFDTSNNAQIGSVFQGGGTILYATNEFIFYNYPSSTLTERMRITSTGNVGIGTTSPTQKLDVNGSVNISGSGVQVPFQIYSGVLPLLQVSSSGKISIGSTANVGNALEVYNTGIFYAGAASAAQLLITTSGSVNREGAFIAASTGRTLQMGINDNSTVPVGIDMFATNNAFESSYLNFRVNNANLVRMTGSFVGVGTINPNATLDVNGSAIITGSLTVTAGITGSLFGTSSWAVSSSRSISSSYSETSTSASYALTASYALNAGVGGAAFPYTGSAQITGSLEITGSLSNGLANIASGPYSHAEGWSTQAQTDYSHAQGSYTVASGTGSHAEGDTSNATGNYSHAEGYSTISSGQGSHAEGYSTTATGNYSHAEGQYTIATGDYSHAEGNSTVAFGGDSHAEGNSSTASGSNSHAEGVSTLSSGFASHAEGSSTIASGEASHAEGLGTLASGIGSHAEGNDTVSSGQYSHAEGQGTVSEGNYSHAEGRYTVASGSYQHVQGQFNISSSVAGAFIHGNGTSLANRSNLIYAYDSIVEITGSLNVSGSITGSLFGTASRAISSSHALTSSNVQGGASNYVPLWNTATSLTTSSIYQSGLQVGIGTTAAVAKLHVVSNTSGPVAAETRSAIVAANTSTDLIYPNSIGLYATVSTYEGIAVYGKNTSGLGWGGYFEGGGYFSGNVGIGTTTPSTKLNVEGAASGPTGPTGRSLVYVNNTSTELTYNNPIGIYAKVSGSTGAAAIYGENLDSNGYGGYFIGKGYFSNNVGIGKEASSVKLDVNGNTTVTGSLIVTAGITGSLFGTSSWAQNVTTATNALSASNFVVTSTLQLDGSLTDFATVNSTIVGANNLYTQATGSHTSAFVKYTVSNGANSRAGEFITNWNGTTVTYFDNSTTDIGSTSDIVFSSAIVSSQIQINATAATSGWKIKTLATFI